MRHARVLLAAAPAIVLAIAACGADQGINSRSRSAARYRTVDITMVDNAYRPAIVAVSAGETVTLRFRNTGAARHEGVIGDAATQERHHEEMSSSTGGGHGRDSMEGMDHGGEEASPSDAVTVEPGRTAELTHTFDHDGEVVIGCHEPGHWEAGMKARVTVS